NDRDFRAATLGEHGGKTLVGDQRQHLVRELLALGLAPLKGVAHQEIERGIAPPLDGDVRQRLQQAMYQRATLERARALRDRLAGFALARRLMAPPLPPAGS